MRRDLYRDLYNLEIKHWWHISKRKIVQSLIKRYNEIQNPKILDVGCGAGKHMSELRKVGRVWGIDQSPDAVKYCKKRGLKNVKIGNAEQTHLSSDSFDIITLLDVLEHTDDNKTLKELRRILKKDGILIITVPAFSWLWSRWDDVLLHQRRYTKTTLTGTLRKNNLNPIKITYLYSFLLLPVLIIRKIKQIFFIKNYPSDFKLSNSFLNTLLYFFTRVEFFFAQRLTIPFGTSLIVVAKKK